MLESSQKLLSSRAGKFTAILSSATVALLLVGAGCDQATSTDTSLNTSDDTVRVPPVGTPAPQPTTTIETAPVTKGDDTNGSREEEEHEGEKEDESDDDDDERGTPTMTAPVKPATPSTYKDGTYKADGAYKSPAGAELVTVSITLKGQKIADVAVTPHATNGISVKMQNAFIGGIKAVVVGKSLDEVNVGKVAGSSLTGAGFNDAVAKIKVEAKS